MNRLRGSDNVLMLQWISNESETALINLSDKRTPACVIIMLHSEDHQVRFMSKVRTEICLRDQTWV